MLDLLQQMLRIPSPTFHEEALVAFLKDWALRHIPGIQARASYGSLLLELPGPAQAPHICLVGHSDVVPAHFEPRIEAGRLHGAGTSDMLGAVAAFLAVARDHHQAISRRFRLSILIYPREEGTALPQNGLYDLVQHESAFLRSIDLAVVGEPTDLTVQLGCCGSLHARIRVEGQACHSARPWNGSNALYKALPFIQRMAALEPVRHRVFGCDFHDVIQITEAHCEPGRTSLPGWWEANVNYRYAPVRSPAAAETELREMILGWNVEGLHYEVKDDAPAGAVIETPLFTHAVATLGAPVEAKQAWTDVAQLSALGVPCFNYGPGLTAQAHKKDEFILLANLEPYQEALSRLLSSDF